MTLRLSLVGILLAFFGGISPVMGQTAAGCRAYEQELKVYFEDIYQSGQRPRMELVENAFSSCPQPTQMMRLLYYYFKSVDALTANSPDKRMSYMDANYMYDLSVREFDVLVGLPKDEEPFAKLFIQRAQWLEEVLASRGSSVGFRTQGAPKGQSNPAQEDAWQKTTLDAGVALENIQNRDRGQGSPATQANARFDKNYLYEGIYQPENPWQEVRKDENLDPWFRPDRDANRERYGVVGDIGNLNMFEYIRWQNEQRAALGIPAGDAPDNLTVLDEQDRSVAATSRTTYNNSNSSNTSVTFSPYRSANEFNQPPGTNVGSTVRLGTVPAQQQATSRGASSQQTTRSPLTFPSQATTVTNLYNPLAIRSLPDGNATSIAIAIFGENLSLVAGENAIVANGVSFTKVRNDLGQEGWVEQSALVRGGRLAAVVQNTNAYTGSQTNAAAIALEPTQLIVLADIQGSWVKGYSEHGESTLWFNSIDGLTIDPQEVNIAHAFQEAKRLALMTSRKQQVMEIRQLPGYTNSAFRPYVEAYLKTL